MHDQLKYIDQGACRVRCTHKRENGVHVNIISWIASACALEKEESKDGEREIYNPFPIEVK